MKQCPQCHRLYEDDSLRFCLDDGTPLVRQSQSEKPPTTVRINAPLTYNEKATEVLPASNLPRPTQTQPLIPWIVAGAALLLVVVMGLGILILIIATHKSATSSANSNGSSFDKKSSNSNWQDSSEVINLAGTTWTQTSTVSQMTEFNFLPNGTINNHPEDTWQQTGNTLFISMTNGYAYYVGTITRDHIDYKAHNKVNFDWTGTLYRAK
jgi:hypothetical protein